MKKYILLLFALILSFPLLAQLEVKEESFKEVPGFVNINTEKMYDDNDKPYAVLKIKTENISSKERHELSFKGDAQTFFEVEYKDGEVWLYISYYATYIKISHEEFSSTEFHFPFDMKPKCGYELILINKTTNNGTGSGSLTITTKPENGATISLNGRVLSQKTPYTNDVIASGKYEVRVSKYGFESVTKRTVIKDGIVTELNIEMPYSYGKIRIDSEPSGAMVIVDNKEYDTTPIVVDSLKFGTHILVLKKQEWETYKREFAINDENTQVFNIILDKCPNGAINGLFSISPTKQVYFSQGNLHYQASTTTWRFAEHQWDYVGGTNDRISIDYNGWIDLFGYGTGKKPTNNSDLLTDYTLTTDWGNNIISNGYNEKWRTLSKDEWIYIFNIRITKDGIRYVKAQVNGVNGVILLPDNWNQSNYSLNNTNQEKSSFNSNIISMTDWTYKLEAYGAIFLPASGYRTNYRNTSYYGDSNFSGHYWSSSYENSSRASVFDVYFGDKWLRVDYPEYTKNGFSVRLVCDTEE